MIDKIILLHFFLFICSLCSARSADDNIYNEIDNAIIKYNNTDSIAYINHVISKIEMGFLEEEQIEELNSKLQTSHLYRIKGRWEISNGSIELAHKYLYNTIDLYKQQNTMESKEWVSKCYYWLFGAYIRDSDTLGLKQSLHELQMLRETNTNVNTISYNYYISLSVYQGILYDKTYNKEYLDKFLSYADSAIYFLNKIPQDKKVIFDINSCNIYYNIAVAYYMYSEPKDVKMIYHYLALTKAGLVDVPKIKDRLSAEINLYNMYAWTYLYEKDYPNAIYNIEKAAELIDEAKASYNNLIAKRKDVHLFFIELYESTGEFAKANERYKSLIKDLKNLYDIEKSKAISELQIKYEVAKKEADIVVLNQQLKQQATNIRLVIVIVAVVILLVLLIISLVVMHRRSVEQKEFEEALLADNKFDVQANMEQTILDKLKKDFPDKSAYFERVNVDQLNELVRNASAPLTAMEKRYITCFLAGIKPSEVAEMFFVGSNTVYCVKYRVKKKLVGETIPF